MVPKTLRLLTGVLTELSVMRQMRHSVQDCSAFCTLMRPKHLVTTACP